MIMKKVLNFKFIYGALIVLGTSFMITSCGDDDIIGCTDPNAENYNAEANVSGDCTYSRDKFLGNYLGSLRCPTVLSILDNDSLEFSIVEGLDANITEDIILSITLNDFPLALAGTVSGDTLGIAHTLEDVTINDLPVVGSITADVIADGRGTMSTDLQTLSADLGLVIETGIPLVGNLSDNCVITGIRQ